MNRAFLNLYQEELKHIRENAKQFGREHPKIAGRLAMDQETDGLCPDPFVERLLEGFAFMAARVRLRLDSDFPRFCESLLETVYPQFLAPVPSMGIVKFGVEDDAPPNGFLVPRGTSLRAFPGRGKSDTEIVTSCIFRTAHPVQLFPVEIKQVRYHTRDMSQLDLPASVGGRAALRITLGTLGGLPLRELKLDSLDFFISSNDVSWRLYEQIFGHTCAVVGHPGGIRPHFGSVLPAETVQPVGFSPEECLLPFSFQSLDGYRLLREYFAIPERFLFFRLTNLSAVDLRTDGNEFHLILVFDQADPRLERVVSTDSLQLNCTPVINLYSKHIDDLHLTDRFWEFPLCVDKTRPLDYEIFDIESVVGVGRRTGEGKSLKSFYWTKDGVAEKAPYYSLHREKRAMTAEEARLGARSSYLGSLVRISLVDRDGTFYEGPVTKEDDGIQSLRIKALVTNRHLPIQMPVGVGPTDFDVIEGPVKFTQFLRGPTPPRPSRAEGEFSWQIINQLSLNYLSLCDGDKGAVALRQILALHCDDELPGAAMSIEGLRRVEVAPVLRRVESPGPLCFARGLEVKLTFDEDHFSGSGVFLLGAVLARFLEQYANINSFVETVLCSVQRQEIMRWKARPGAKALI